MTAQESLPAFAAVHTMTVETAGFDDFIKQDQAVIYWMDTGGLEEETCFRAYYQAMSPARRKKVDSCLFGKDKRLSLGAGILLDQGLSAYGLRERTTKTAYGEKGKPYLPEHPHIHFNLSHAGSRAMAVFAGVETGCDIEQVQKADLELAEKFFTPGEYTCIVGQREGKQQDEMFYRLWTLKESFLKAVGEGLILDLDAFEINVSPAGKVSVAPRKKEALKVCRGEFAFRQYRLGEYCAAVCFWKSPQKALQ